MLTEFAEEVSAPGKKEQFEKEVIALEAERGVQVVFVEPKPGFAIALQLKKNKDSSYVYLNICSNETVGKPKCTRVDTGNKKGLNWELPHLIPQPRKEIVNGVVLPGQNENNKEALLVYDVVFHPDALHLAARNRLMRDTVIKSAVDSLVNTYKLSVKCNIEIEKTQYVGKVARSVVRKIVNEKLHKQCQSVDNDLSFPPPREENQVESDERTSKIQSKSVNNVSSKKAEKVVNKDGTLEPVHKIKYVSKSDLQDYAIPIIPRCGTAYRPHVLELTIELPGVERASQLDVNITQQHLVLTTESKPKYKLDLNLPYPVDEELSTAKFDVATKYLSLTLSVIEEKSKTENVNVCSPASDSGIECESGYRTNSDGDNSSEVSVSSQEGSEEQNCGGEDQDISVWEEPTPEIVSQALLIPSYNVSQSKDVLEISINAGNVVAESVNVVCKSLKEVEVTYSSIGGGYVPLHYQLVISCPHNVLEESIKYDLREHTFDIHITKKESIAWKIVKVGNHDNLNPVEVGNYSEIVSSEKSDETSESAIHTSTESVIQETLEATKVKAVIETEVEVVKSAEIKTPERPAPEVVEQSRKSRLCRAVSECESQSAANNRKRNGLTSSWPRGILKRRSRSLSDSQSGRFSPGFDTFSNLGSSQEFCENGEVEVADEDSLSSSVKKSVRFNEVVHRQLFSTNSSICGGKGAKNQKKIKKEKVPLLDESDRDSCSDSSPHKKYEILKYLEKLDSDITTTDSNTEAEDNNNEATENIDPNVKSKKDVQGNNNNNKNGKKNKRNKNKKVELSNNMIFQLDIEA